MPSDPLFVIVVLAVLLVVVVLMFGLGGFAGGGAFNKRNANKIMRLRLITQFIAVVLIVAYVYLRKDVG
ncbi:twin transmembrane helix small protein [Sulfitobacter sp. SK011]|uniref:twin transmembrane helix small protein n=1 Tax=Sulfitobacter sp. SK011 TaxID=1389004 RepID=UPI000E0B04F4|nr:twin transmembrane helix small protein [Sulfitobacter sp. SK011]AXI43663.1 twin transmembrane helix small protein [Sulfitobacter sp. SK011]